MPLDGPARPFSKTSQVARGPRKYRRKIASPKQWAGLQAERQGPCILCGNPPPNELHHIVPRDRGGDDVADNLLPLCRVDHRLVEDRDPRTVRRFVHMITLDERAPGARAGCRDAYSYAVEKVGEDWAERLYGVRYEAAA